MTEAASLAPAGRAPPVLVAAAGGRASVRFVEFLAAAIRNPHTRRAYARAAGEFLGWCAGAGVTSIAEVQPLHVAAWIGRQTQTHSAPTVRQRLAAIRHLFDWLVTGQIVPHNPAASVRGPSHTAKKGKTPVLDASEARQLLDRIGGVDAEMSSVQLIHRGKHKTLTSTQRRWLKRRQAIEPIIGHVKHDHGMRRCWLKGQTGDALHAVLCAAGYNLRWLLRAIVRGMGPVFFFFALLHWLANVTLKPALARHNRFRWADSRSSTGHTLGVARYAN